MQFDLPKHLRLPSGETYSFQQMSAIVLILARTSHDMLRRDCLVYIPGICILVCLFFSKAKYLNYIPLILLSLNGVGQFIHSVTTIESYNVNVCLVTQAIAHYMIPCYFGF